MSSWFKNTTITTRYELNLTAKDECRVVLFEERENDHPATFRWMIWHVDGMFDARAGSATSIEDASEKAMSAIPGLLQEREEYYRRRSSGSPR